MAAGNIPPGQAIEAGEVRELCPGFSQYLFGSDVPSEALEGGELEKLRFVRIGVQGEGSCFFHSFLYATSKDYVNETKAGQRDMAYKFRCSFGKKLTRDKLKDIIKKSKGKSPASLEEVKEALCDPKVWADETIIRWVSESLDMNLLFLDLEKKSMYCGVHLDAATDDMDATKLPTTIIFSWVNHSHFEPLGLLLDSNDKIARLQCVYEPSKSKRDAAIVQAIMTHYKMKCKIKSRERS